MVIGGAIAGFAVGVTAGAVFGLATYDQAVTGKCGCEMQQQAIASGGRGYYTGAIMITSGAIGGVAGAVAASAPIGMLIVGAGGITFSTVDAVKTYNIIKNETGITSCTLLRALFDLAGVLGSSIAIKGAVNAFRAGGSWLDWGWGGGSPIALRPGYNGPSQGWSNIKPSDLMEGYNGITLETAIANESYRPPSNLIGSSPLLQNTAKFIYVIDENGMIMVSRAGIHHPDLVNGNNVFGAGEMFINQQGEIVLINNLSGHYLPPKSMFFGYLEYLLTNLGIKVLPGAYQ